MGLPPLPRRRRRQWQFCRSALVLLGVQTLHNAIFVTSYSVAVATLSCEPPWQAVAALNFLRRTCVATMLFLFLNDIYAMTAWRGKGALDMPVSERAGGNQPRVRPSLEGAVVLSSLTARAPAAGCGARGRSALFPARSMAVGQLCSLGPDRAGGYAQRRLKRESRARW